MEGAAIWALSWLKSVDGWDGIAGIGKAVATMILKKLGRTIILLSNVRICAFLSCGKILIREASIKQNTVPAQPWPFPPSIIDWIGTAIDADRMNFFPTLLVFVNDRQHLTRSAHNFAECRFEVSRLTPRTMALTEYIHQIKKTKCGPAENVEAMANCKITKNMMETFPEAVVATLQQSIVMCQSDPPTKWNKDLLKLISREDMIVEPHAVQESGQDGSSIVVSYGVSINKMTYRYLIVSGISSRCHSRCSRNLPVYRVSRDFCSR